MKTTETTPLKTWKKNKNRIDLRKYTREFEKKFKIKSKCPILPGNVYAIYYTPDNSIITDKYHITCIILSLGNFIDENNFINIRGLNLLYLSCVDCLQDLELANSYSNKKQINKIIDNIKHHDIIMNKYPHNIKNFIDKRICCAVEIQKDEWGMIPLLQKHLLGSFNSTLLAEDYKKEFKSKKIIKKQEIKQDSNNTDEFYSENLIETSIDDFEDDI